MKDKINEMGLYELNEFLKKVQCSALDNKERYKLYDEIERRRASLNRHEAEILFSEVDFDELS